MARFEEGLKQAWESLAEGWRELGHRASGALTRFKPSSSGPASQPDDDLPALPGWSFLGADLFEDDEKLVVRLEAPGMRRDDFQVELDGDVLLVRGEKRFERESGKGRYRVMQCAYGTFRREIALPVPVRADRTKASYRDGVLRIELPKTEAAKSRRVEVH